jgi:cob(I)alamin adenosyltransferase
VLKIYTRTGDAGETALFGGGRVKKAHPRVNAYGTVDELNSSIGVAVSMMEESEWRNRLAALQHDLFVLGAVLATPPPAGARRRPTTPEIPLGRVEQMEGWMDEADRSLEPLRTFILPGGTRGAAALHLSRTICRRAEREVVALGHDEPLESDIVRYLNRLSDLLFTLARMENFRAGVPDVLWQKEEPLAPE